MKTSARGDDTNDKILCADGKTIIFKSIDALQCKMIITEEVFTKYCVIIKKKQQQKTNDGFKW